MSYDYLFIMIDRYEVYSYTHALLCSLYKLPSNTKIAYCITVTMVSL